MAQSSSDSRIKALNLYDNDEQVAKISSALSVKVRRDIIRLINLGGLSINEIAWKLNIPVSTASFHVKVLVDAGLLIYSSATKKIGNEKRVFLGDYLFTIFTGNPSDEYVTKNETQTIDIPIGSYTSYHVEPTCGIATSQKMLFITDTPCVFSSPERFQAGLIWMNKGYLEYGVPLLDYSTKNFNDVQYTDRKSIISLCFSFEICSECASFNHNFKSDVSFWINNKHLCNYTCPGDFGERRGALNPEWWPDNLTQYGLLQTLDVRFDGTYLNEKRVSDVCIGDLDLATNGVLTFKIGILDNAKHVGGLNLFGKSFGDYPQDIILTVTYQKTIKKIDR